MQAISAAAHGFAMPGYFFRAPWVASAVFPEFGHQADEIRRVRETASLYCHLLPLGAKLDLERNRVT
jgi:hypothetical protein